MVYGPWSAAGSRCAEGLEGLECLRACTWVGGRGVVPTHGTHPPRTLVLPGPNPSPRPRYLRPPGHSRALLALPHTRAPRTQYPASRTLIWARFRVIYPKVSQLSGVSPKVSHEACHTPCFRNRPKSHDLEIPRFPLSVAFSHKE